MLITDELFASFIKCETKSYLTATHFSEAQSELLDSQRRILDDYKRKCRSRLHASCHNEEYFAGSLSPDSLRHKRYALVTDCVLETERIKSAIHALERSPSTTRRQSAYIPIRFLPALKITKHDKLLLAFDAIAISMALGGGPMFGKIIHGPNCKATKVLLSGLIQSVNTIVESMVAKLSGNTPPELILNQ